MSYENVAQTFKCQDLNKTINYYIIPYFPAHKTHFFPPKNVT